MIMYNTMHTPLCNVCVRTAVPVRKLSVALTGTNAVSNTHCLADELSQLAQSDVVFICTIM